MPRSGKPAARTAAPQPPNTSQKVPKTSAAIRRDLSIVPPHPSARSCWPRFRRTDRKEQISGQFSLGTPKLNSHSWKQLLLCPAIIDLDQLVSENYDLKRASQFHRLPNEISALTDRW